MVVSEYFYFDLETTGLNPRTDQIHGIAYIDANGEAQYEYAWAISDYVKQKLADPSVRKVFHSGKRFDPKFIIASGLELNGELHDTLYYAKEINENRPLGLKPLSLSLLGPESLGGKADLDRAMHEAGVKNIGAFCKMDLMDPAHPFCEIISLYAKEDVRNMRDLHLLFIKRLREIDIKVKKTFGADHPSPLTHLRDEVIPTESYLRQIESGGVRVNLELIEEVRKQAEVVRLNLRNQLDNFPGILSGTIEIEKGLLLKAQVGKKNPVPARSEKHKTIFNWDSNAHVGRLVHEFVLPKGVEAGRTSGGAYKMDEVYLSNLQKGDKKNPLGPEDQKRISDFLILYSRFKKQAKIIGTYTGTNKKGIRSRVVTKEGMPWIYYGLSQTPKTWRTSSYDPNMQNLPRSSPVKRFFIPRSDEKLFLYGDYSQIQLRIAADLSGDPNFIDAYTNDLDFHKITAARIFRSTETEVTDEQRQVGKTCNFLLIFLGFARRLQGELKEKNGLDYSLDQCKELIENYYDYVRVYRWEYLENEIEFMKRHRFQICKTGAIRRLPEIEFGEYLDYRNRQFTGPYWMVKEIRKKLAQKDKIYQPTPEEIYKKANRIYNHALKQGINAPFQTIEAAIVKGAIGNLLRAKFDVKLMVHDSIIVEVDKSRIYQKEQMKEIMESSYQLSVPLKVDIKVIKSFDEKDKYIDKL